MERIQKKIKGILIGCGKIGGFYDTPDSTEASKEIYSYVAAIDRSNTLELVGCVDINIKKAYSLAQRFKIARHESSVDKLIAKEVPSFVIVATPDATHFDIVSQLLSLENPPRLIIVEKPTYYIFPMRFIPEKCNLKRDEFIKALNAEGFLFFQGYVKPLYFQPIYQKKQLFKHGYPFNAVENKKLNMNYKAGICSNAERLHFKEMIINEHIRLPNKIEDIKDVLGAIEKIVSE